MIGHFVLASQFYPARERCTRAARAFHARNVYQVIGRGLDTTVDLVICWTPRGSGSGGTGQAIRIARQLNIPVFDLAVCTEQDIFDFINTKN